MSEKVSKTLVETWGWGCYPAGYNRAVHGPYDPARYYGPKDTAFAEVKVADLTAWLMRRDKSPRAITGAISRARFRWQDKFAEPRRARLAPFLQFLVLLSASSYLLQWKTLREYICQNACHEHKLHLLTFNFT